MLMFYRAERLSAYLIVAVLATAMLLALARGISIDYASFGAYYAGAAGLVAVAIYYRRSGRSPEIALTLVCCALFILFTNSGAMLNYVVIRPGAPLLDPVLFRADAVLGFDWQSFAESLARLGPFTYGLGWVYQSSLYQLVLVIVVLGFRGRHIALHRFLLSGILCSCASIAFWAVLPSFGPSVFVTLDPISDAQLGRIVDKAYAAQLVDLALNGPATVTANSLLGLIAFPSMHTVMAAMGVWYTRGTRVFWYLVLLNLAMVPAILVHGGHHLVDVLAGSTLFAVSAVLVRHIVPSDTPTLAADKLGDRSQVRWVPSER